MVAGWLEHAFHVVGGDASYDALAVAARVFRGELFLLELEVEEKFAAAAQRGGPELRARALVSDCGEEELEEEVVVCLDYLWRLLVAREVLYLHAFFALGRREDGEASRRAGIRATDVSWRLPSAWGEEALSNDVGMIFGDAAHLVALADHELCHEVVMCRERARHPL